MAAAQSINRPSSAPGVQQPLAPPPLDHPPPKFERTYTDVIEDELYQSPQVQSSSGNSEFDAQSTQRQAIVKLYLLKDERCGRKGCGAGR